jgi:hyaluronan synthase
MRRFIKHISRIALGLLPLLGAIGATLWMSRDALRADTVGWATPTFLLLIFLQMSCFLLQSFLWMRYQAYPIVRKDDTLPRLTVVIPTFNEGPMVERSIRSVVAADYPHDKLEIIAVDDGSRDDTYFHMERIRREYPALVRIVRFGGNRGKRAGLCAGITAARGEVVLTLDSDSEIEQDTLRAMVAPLVADARVGAVAGRVAVLNRATLLGRMLEVQYALAFDFGRAAQSATRTVLCCPGALSAFRRSVILPHLDRWMHQTFLGRPVSHGEDQALTNVVLRAGYDTVYQRSAVVRTLAPQHYRQLFRMLTRWDRSFIVEGFEFGRFMFAGCRRGRRILPSFLFVVGTARLLIAYGGLLFLPGILLAHPSLIFNIGVGFLIASTFSALYYLHNERSLRFLYGILYAFYAFFLLQWTLPWALLTVRDERWGTR